MDSKSPAIIESIVFLDEASPPLLNNPEGQIIHDLQAPLRSFLVFGLEQAIQVGSSQELLDVMKAMQRGKTDPEIYMLLSYAITAVESRLQKTILPGNSDSFEPEKFAKEFFAVEAIDRLKKLSTLSGPQINSLSDFSHQLFEQEENLLIKSRILKVFSKKWQRSQMSDLNRFLSSESLVLRMTALEVLAKAAPEILLNDLPQLLNSPEARVRALAVRGLVAIDQPEAILHFGGMLRSPDRGMRAAGIDNLIWLSFEVAKPLLIEFLANESDPTLLNRATILLASNPHHEVPFQVFELMENSSEEKRAILKRILLVSLNAFRLSGMPEDDFEAYRKNLQTWINKRTQTKQIEHLFRQISLADSETWPGVLLDVEPLLQKEGVREALQGFLGNPLSAEVRTRIEQICRSDPPDRQGEPSSTPIPTAAPSENSQGDPNASISRNLSGMTKDSDENRQVLDSILCSIANYPPSLVVSAFKAAGRIKRKDWAAAAEKALSHSPESVIAAALEYLIKTEPDRVAPFFGKFLATPSFKIQSAILRYLKETDFSVGLSKIQAFLSSKNPALHRLGLNCMLMFDFVQVRSVLTDFLRHDHADELFDQGLQLFEANPDPENLFCLFKVEVSKHSANRERVRVLRKKTQAQMVELGLLKAGDTFTEDKLQNLFDEEIKAQEKPRQPYSFQKLHSSGNATALGLELLSGGLPQLWETILAWRRLVFGMFFLIASVAFFFDGGGKLPDIQKAGAILAPSMEFSGKILERKSFNSVLARSVDGTEVILKTNHLRGFRGFQIGEDIQGTIQPFRKGPSGTFVAEIWNVRRRTAE